MTGPLYAIGGFCSRHHYPTIAAWLIAAVALVFAGQAGDSKTNDNLTLPGTGSTSATELLEDDLPEQAYGSNPLVLEARGGATITEAKYATAVKQTVKRLNAMHDVNSAVDPLSAKGAAFLSKNRTVAYVPVVLAVGPSELTESQAQAVLDAAKPAEAAGLKVSVGAYVGQQLSKPDTAPAMRSGLRRRSSSCCSPSEPRRQWSSRSPRPSSGSPARFRSSACSSTRFRCRASPRPWRP